MLGTLFSHVSGFDRIVTTDGNFDTNVDKAKYIRNDTSILDNLPVDIQAATLYSNEKTLNATIWLSDPIYNDRHMEYVRSNLAFTMEIWSEDENEEPTDYTHNVTIYPNSDGTWTKVVKDYEPNFLYWEEVPIPALPPRAHKEANSVYNYTEFYKDGERYIQIYIDTFGLPDTFWVTFSSDAVNKNGILLFDRTFFEHVPPKLNLIDYEWPNVSVRAGEERSFTVPINTTDLDVIQTFNFTDANKEDGISIRFEPEFVELPKSGLTNVKLIVKAQEYTFRDNPTLTNQTILTTISSVEGQENSMKNNEDFGIEILRPLSPLEKISNFLRSNYGSFFIPLIVTTAFAIWLSKRIDKNEYNSEWIRVKDILTVDASVIAGVLIFLTVASSEKLFSPEVILRVGIMTASIVFPFAIAAVITLIKGNIEHIGIKFMISGFVYLMTSVILIAFIQG